ncbi:MAG: diacylglycerol kinase [Crocinitomicaceae bacterium]|nr:diacylglycerol kinase [Crocinitomicaceae bacterium]|tara:strand:- start:239 stop:616 length:378 start_codon:yes stop_codon:yes gene_type:complete
MNQEKFSLRKRIKSFGYAFSGIATLLKEEHNARIHAVATVCVIVAGIYFKVSVTEWIALVFAIGLVFALEAVNTAIEALADFASPEQHPLIKKAKDVAAAAVLIGAFAAAAVGLFIFLPKVIEAL